VYPSKNTKPFCSQPQMSVIICTHNPRKDYLRRTLESLRQQSLPASEWELLLIDNASDEPLAGHFDLSWHPNARHVAEEELGLTPARLRGISEARGDLLVFVDDDNVLVADYLACAAAIRDSYPYLRVFGAGALQPEFEAEPERAVRPWLGMLALRVVSRARWTNNATDWSCLPYGAGLCVPRTIAVLYSELVRHLATIKILDRVGENLYCGGDDLFSWLSARNDAGFGIFPELRVTHLISAKRVQREYFLRLVRAHRFSHAVLRYLLDGTKPPPAKAVRHLRLIAHGLKNGWFSMRCKQAGTAGQSDAAKFIRNNNLKVRSSGTSFLCQNQHVMDKPGRGSRRNVKSGC
jgi:glycosyltransferase involved in cell wall biosynthesis